MPIFSSKEIDKIMKMMDTRFFDIMDRVDESYKGGGELTPPKVSQRKKPMYIHEGMQIEQHKENLKDLLERGVL